MEFLKHTLANGLEIVAEHQPRAHSLALGFFVLAGARDETDDVSGVSHFLEHMVFKGTVRRSAEDVNREFDEMGAHYNAFTSEENTVYYAAMLPEYQEAAVELLSDIMRPALREIDFNTEKQVILEEIQMYLDQPPFGADDKCRALYFGRHPLGRSVLGTIASIEQLPLEAMRAYHRLRYSPGNIAVVAAGRVDFDALTRQLERRCGDWEPQAAARVAMPAEGASSATCLRKEGATLEYLLQISPGPCATDSDRYAAKILATVVGDDTGSRLFWELVDPGLAEQASLSHYDYQGAGLMMTYLCCDPAKAQVNVERLLSVYRRVEQEGLSAAELAQAKSKINSRVVLASERPRGRLFTVGGNWLQRKEYRTVQDDLSAVEAITLDDLAAVLKKYPLSQGTMVGVGPLADLFG